MSQACKDFLTPAKEVNPFEELNPRGSRKRKQIDFASREIVDCIETQQASASPSFKKAKDMPACRSPSLIKKATLQVTETPMDTNQSRTTPQVGGQEGTNVVSQGSTGAAPALIDPSFLEKMDKKMDLLTSGMMSISSRVDEQAKKLGENSAAISAQGDAISANSRDIADIFRRLEDMQEGRVPPPGPRERAVCSHQYLLARRSVRIWPITAVDEETISGKSRGTSSRRSSGWERTRSARRTSSL